MRAQQGQSESRGVARVPLGRRPHAAAHQICYQVWLASSLLADALAVAAQSLLARRIASRQPEAGQARRSPPRETVRCLHDNPACTDRRGVVAADAPRRGQSAGQVCHSLPCKLRCASVKCVTAVSEGNR